MTDPPLEEWEYPDEEDLDQDDETLAEVTPCPSCGEMIYDQAQQCPYCKRWVSGQLANWRGSPAWYVRGGRWLTKTLLLNWAFWLVLTALAVLTWILRH